MSGISKISRLSKETRDTLNERLRDGEAGPGLLEWLNGLPEVKELVAARFDGLPVTKQNLSAWRRGAYKSWLSGREALEQAEDLMENAARLGGCTGGGAMTDGTLTEGLSAILASRYAWVLNNWGRWSEKRFQDELQALRGVARDVAQLRKGDHNVARLELRRDWRTDYSRKQIVGLFKNWAEREVLTSWVGMRWKDPDFAARYFWQAMGYNNPEVEEIMKQPDQLPPWEMKKRRDQAHEDWLKHGNPNFRKAS